MTTEGIARRSASIALGSALVIALAMLLPTVASAGKARGGTNFSYAASSGEQNQLLVLTGAKATASNPSPGSPFSELTDFGATASKAVEGCIDAPARQLEGAPNPSPSVACNSKKERVNINVRNGNDFVKVSGTYVAQLNGASGNDKLASDGGRDRLNGGSGNDQLYGGAGEDSLVGGAGNDEIDANDDNVRDVINCGSGIDSVYTDIDTQGNPTADTLKGCEKVFAPRTSFIDNSGNPGGDDDFGPYLDEYGFLDLDVTDTDTACAAVVAAGKSAKVSRKRTVTLKLVAPKNASYTCTGTLSVQAKAKRAKGAKKGKRKKARSVRLGSGYFVVDPGNTTKVKVKLNKKAAKLLKRSKSKKLKATVTVRTDQDEASVASTKSMTLKAKKPKKSKR